MTGDERFPYEVPAVVEVGVRCGRRHLADAAAFGVVGEGGEDNVVGGDGRESIRRIIVQGKNAIGEHVAVSVIRKMYVLVEAICRPVGGIADLVIAIRMENGNRRMENCVRYLAAGIVAKGVSFRGRAAHAPTTRDGATQRIVCVGEGFNGDAVHGIGDGNDQCAAVGVTDNGA